jgi:hypothetical protein
VGRRNESGLTGPWNHEGGIMVHNSSTLSLFLRPLLMEMKDGGSMKLCRQALCHARLHISRPKFCDEGRPSSSLCGVKSKYLCSYTTAKKCIFVTLSARLWPTTRLERPTLIHQNEPAMMKTKRKTTSIAVNNSRQVSCGFGRCTTARPKRPCSYRHIIIATIL